MSNTTNRVVFGLLMAVTVIILLYLGSLPTIVGLVIAGLLVVDELYCNFFRRERFDLLYISNQLVFLALTLFWPFVSSLQKFGYYTLFISTILNVLLLVYLFGYSFEKRLTVNSFKKNCKFVGLLVALLIIPLIYLATKERMAALFFLLLVINFGMDSGAWLFGRTFGKHKLWPKVSPNKTVEGLIGGAFSSGLLGIVALLFLFDKWSVLLFIVFFLSGIVSQVGDLVQSKLKRQFEIKDSSSLIPGHGGVYDRIDSLVFLSPFFIISLEQFSF